MEMSVEAELDGIAARAAGDGVDLLGKLADQFRVGRSIDELVAVLGTADPDVLEMALWIFSEIDFEQYDRQDILDKLASLTCHKVAAVRLQSLIALFPAFGRTESTYDSVLDKLCSDPNPGVCQAAKQALDRLGDRRD